MPTPPSRVLPWETRGRPWPRERVDGACARRDGAKRKVSRAIPCPGAVPERVPERVSGESPGRGGRWLEGDVRVIIVLVCVLVCVAVRALIRVLVSVAGGKGAEAGAEADETGDDGVL